MSAVCNLIGLRAEAIHGIDGRKQRQHVQGDTMNRFLPKSALCLRAYTWPQFRSDLLAGVTVGLVALPLAMAFAIASGVPPEAGLYCAVITGFLISALGGSRTQIGGPTGAFVVVVSGIVATYGLDGLFHCTMMAGVMLLLLGLTGLGSVVKFIPRPVVIGFTNGIAVLIASTQIKDFFGLTVEKVPGEFLGRLEALASQFHTLSASSTILAVSSVAVIVLCMRFVKRVPGSIVALLLGTLAVVLLRLPVETIGTRFGGIPAGLPAFHLPTFQPAQVPPLLAPAFTVAMLGAIESLLSAVVSDRMSGDRHNPNVELMAQGVANLASPLFGGLPATGAIARTATNIKSGAQTPVAGMVHALTLLAVLLFAAPLASHIPLPVLAGILAVVSYNMGEWKEIPKILKMTWADIAVWLATFLLTVFADLTLAVEVGIVLAALLYLGKVARTTTVSRVTREHVEQERVHVLENNHIPEYVTVFRIHGPFLFGSAEKVHAISERTGELTPIVILRLREMTAIDATGLLALEEMADRLHTAGHTLILCGARRQPAKLMKQVKFEKRLGRQNLCPSIAAALARAEQIHAGRQQPLQMAA
jgi:SulP family sulfate permease